MCVCQTVVYSLIYRRHHFWFVTPRIETLHQTPQNEVLNSPRNNTNYGVWAKQNNNYVFDNNKQTNKISIDRLRGSFY